MPTSNNDTVNIDVDSTNNIINVLANDTGGSLVNEPYSVYIKDTDGNNLLNLFDKIYDTEDYLDANGISWNGVDVTGVVNGVEWNITESSAGTKYIFNNLGYLETSVKNDLPPYGYDEVVWTSNQGTNLILREETSNTGIMTGTLVIDISGTFAFNEADIRTLANIDINYIDGTEADPDYFWAGGTATLDGEAVTFGVDEVSSLKVTSVGNATNGTVTIVDGEIQYTPNADFSGADSFSYIVTDSVTGEVSTATVNVDVVATEEQVVDAWNPLTNEFATYGENSIPEGWLTELPIAWDAYISDLPMAGARVEVDGMPYQSNSEHVIYPNGLMYSVNEEAQWSNVKEWFIDGNSLSMTIGGVTVQNYLFEYTDSHIKGVAINYSSTDGYSYSIGTFDILDRPEYFIDSDNDSYADVIDAYPDDPSNHLNITKNDDIQGTLAIDNITTLGGSNAISAFEGNDTITLIADSVWGAGYSAQNVSNDSFIGTNQKISLNGFNRFSDVIDGGADVDTLNLTDGNDAFFIEDIYSDLHPSFEDYFATTLVVEGTPSSVARIANLEVVNAGEGNDIVDLTSSHYILANAIEINGEAGGDTLWGSNGNDTINGGEGGDTIFGGTGSDTLTGGTGSDIFQFTATAGSDVITDFGVGGDTIQLYYRAEDNHTNADLSLASGILTWDVDSTSNDVVIDLSASINSSDLNDLDALITFVEIV